MFDHSFFKEYFSLPTPTPEELKQLKKGGRNTGYTFIAMCLCLVVLTNAIPENVLDKILFMKVLVQYLVDRVPSIATYGEYSLFPQVSQFVYSLCFILIPCLAYPYYNLARQNIRRFTSAGKGPYTGLVLSCIFILIWIGLFLLGTTPESVYTSKIIFSLWASLMWILGLCTLDIFIMSLMNLRASFRG